MASKDDGDGDGPDLIIRIRTWIAPPSASRDHEVGT